MHSFACSRMLPAATLTVYSKAVEYAPLRYYWGTLQLSATRLLLATIPR